MLSSKIFWSVKQKKKVGPDVLPIPQNVYFIYCGSNTFSDLNWVWETCLGKITTLLRLDAYSRPSKNFSLFKTHISTTKLKNLAFKVLFI